MSGCPFPFATIRSPQFKNSKLQFSESQELFQADMIYAVVAGHIRKDDPVTFLESADNLDGLHRTASQLHLHTACGLAIRVELKHPNHALFLAESRASCIQNVVDRLQGHRSIDA